MGSLVDEHFDGYVAAFPSDFNPQDCNRFDFLKRDRKFLYQGTEVDLEVKTIDGEEFLFWGTYSNDSNPQLQVPSYRVVILNPMPGSIEVRVPFIVGLLAKEGESPMLFGGFHACSAQNNHSDIKAGTAENPAVGWMGMDPSSSESRFSMSGFGLRDTDPLRRGRQLVVGHSDDRLSSFDIQDECGESLLWQSGGSVERPEVFHETPGALTVWRIGWVEGCGSSDNGTCNHMGRRWSFLLISDLVGLIGILIRHRRNQASGDPDYLQRPGIFAAENNLGDPPCGCEEK
ncbi:MAG: hypothetical protein AAGD01_17370 [Acidobacteriota bacterium]